MLNNPTSRSGLIIDDSVCLVGSMQYRDLSKPAIIYYTYQLASHFIYSSTGWCGCDEPFQNRTVSRLYEYLGLGRAFRNT
ncbi:hypothetical protein BDR03DRAFT_383713 [Suillus americanus]|nr:hypothetical protein BDR03DRAFT_383713 [Suillus americanus]